MLGSPATGANPRHNLPFPKASLCDIHPHFTKLCPYSFRVVFPNILEAILEYIEMGVVLELYSSSREICF